MVKRDEMFRIKALIFMVPLVLPIGQPPAEAVSPRSDAPAVETEIDPGTRSAPAVDPADLSHERA